MRDHVLGATLLNGHGEVLTFGGQVMKNVAGYDVSRLLAGSLGMLGVIFEVSLKVLPLPPATRDAALRDRPGRRALARLNDWGGQPLPLNASAWWDGTLMRAPARRRGRGASAARARSAATSIEPALAAAFWDGLRDQRDEFFVAARAAVAARRERCGGCRCRRPRRR